LFSGWLFLFYLRVNSSLGRASFANSLPFVQSISFSFLRKKKSGEIGNISCTSICQPPAKPCDACTQTESAWNKDSELHCVQSCQVFPRWNSAEIPAGVSKADWHFSLRVAIVPRSRHYEVFWLFGLSFEIGKSLGAEGSVCPTTPLRLWMRRHR
jgi:hypothetical protein